ncbi:MAG: hypothetical protein AAF721_28525 [Myxococcota bacterium]
MNLDALNTNAGWLDALEAVGAVDPAALTEARLEAHWAAQVLAAVGFAFVPAVEDFSHTALRFDPEAGRLRTAALPGTTLRAALDFRTLSLSLDDGEAGLERLDLIGNSLDQAMAWMQRTVEKRTDLQPCDGPMDRPKHDLPAHGVADGAPFEGGSPAARQELAAWFSVGQAVTAVVAGRPDASDPLCWPHHFDVATLITLSGSGEDAGSVGVGLSPGDGSYECPYLYINPWPRPEGQTLAPLDGGGRWHTEGWTGAVLTAEWLAAIKGGKARAEAVEAFVTSAIPAAQALAQDAR